MTPTPTPVPTPRTDENRIDVWNDGYGNRENVSPTGPYVYVEFAQQLERDLAAANERVRALEAERQAVRSQTKEL